MNYPYRQCNCGNQIHVGGRNLCDRCLQFNIYAEQKNPMRNWIIAFLAWVLIVAIWSAAVIWDREVALLIGSFTFGFFSVQMAYYVYDSISRRK